MKKYMKKMKKIIKKLFLFLFALCSLPLFAQRLAPEFSINAVGGISTYCFQPRTKGTFSLGYSSDIGFGFAGFFNQNVGIFTGVGFGLFNVKSRIPEVKNVLAGQYDEKNELFFEWRTTLSNYTEIHKTMFVNIPVMFQYQTSQPHSWNWRRGQKAGFYITGGVKVLFLLNNKYESRVDSMHNLAYYPDFENINGTQQFVGLGSFKGNNTAGNLDFGVMAMFAFETGVKWRVDNNVYLYSGIFFDCALNDPNKDRQPNGNFLIPKDLETLTLLKFTKRANLMVIGVKLRIAFTRPQRAY